MKIIKIKNCKHKECPYNYDTFCIKVIVPPKYKYGLNHPKHFTRIERSGKRGFPEWCPLEDYNETN